MASPLIIFGTLLVFSPLLGTAAPTASPVSIGLYYEILCGGCRDFIARQLYPVYLKVGNIMDITLVPYGNAEERWDGTKWEYTCQHGPAECVGNLIETCAISVLANTSSYFPFIHCLETNVGNNPRSTAEQCASQLGIDFGPIDKCQNGPLGNKLEHDMALKTKALQPPHGYVPWITMNGKHTDEIQNDATFNLLQLVCDNYMGTKPEACHERSFASRCYA